MNNYNERLDEIINSAYEGEVSWIHDQLDGTSVMDDAIKDIEDEKAKTKQDITSLIKELVVEAKPEIKEHHDGANPIEAVWETGYNEATREFEQNLLKELEEV